MILFSLTKMPRSKKYFFKFVNYFTANKNIHSSSFSEETLLKLEIFERYTITK